MPTTRVLVLANRPATNAALRDAVRTRALRASVYFHLVMPTTPHRLDRAVDREVAGRQATRERVAPALPALSQVAATDITGPRG